MTAANLAIEYHLGADIKQLAKKHGHSRSTIRAHLAARGVRLRSKGVSFSTEDQLFLITLHLADRARCARCGWEYRVHGDDHDFVWDETGERN